MKRILLFTIMLCVSMFGYSQKWNGLKSNIPTNVKKTLVSSSDKEVVIDVKVDGYYSTTVTTPKGKQMIISADDMASMLKAGAPDLPMFPVSIIVDDNAEMEVSVLNAEYTDIEGVEIAPSKGNLKRKVDPNDVEYVYGEMYQQDAFYPAQQAALETPYILRDFRGQNIMVYPYAYNPVTKTLRVYTHMTISAKKVSDNGVNKKIASRNARTTIDPEVNEAYKRRFINYEASAKRSYLLDEGEMLIVCVDDYLEEIQPLIEWKNISGRPTKVVAVSETGTKVQLKSYLTNYYQENPNLTYVLLVGEYDDLPPYYVDAFVESDNYYGMYEGNDYYEEVFVGRLPVANEADAIVQANKIIRYERDIKEDATWLSKGSGVAANEGAGRGHFGEADYQHIDFLSDTLLNYTYTDISKHYEYINGPTASGMVSDFSQGVGIINYCNHGLPTGWAVADFDVDNVHQLTNDNMLPVIWSVACNNGQFNYTECFGESWMRATNPSTGAATGGIGGMFSWIAQPWVPPMHGQDEMVNILTEWRPNYKHTLGGASLNGNMYILDVCPEDYGETHNSWLLFGDPSMMMRTKAPEPMNVSYSPSVVLVGMSSMSVSADTEFGIATLSVDGEVIASSYVENGVANLTFPTLNEVKPLKLVVVGYNKVTEVKDIEVIPAEGSFIVYENYDLNDDNGQLDYGEYVNLSLNLKNIAVETANNVKVELSTESEYITINDAEATVSAIAPDEVVSVDNQLSFSVASNIPDRTPVKFNVKCSDGTEEWYSDFTIIAYAPVITIDNLAIDNAIGELLPGETSTFTVTFSNTGGSTAKDVKTYLESSSSDVTFENVTLETDMAIPGEQYQVTTKITVSESAVNGALYQVGCKVQSGAYSTFGEFELYAGMIKDDFETGDLSTFEWNDGNAAWSVIQGGYEGEYCVASPANGQNNKTYTLSLTAEIFSDGYVSFYRKVSSEEGYDFLTFSIDNKELGNWSGEADWAKVEFEVESGLHNFKWEYVKDVSSKEGDDRAYIDFVQFPPLLVFKVDVEEVVEDNNVTVYPNPTTGIVNIDVDTRFDAVIYNYQGQMVMKLNDKDGQIDITNLTSGMYLIEIRTDENVMIKKIIKK